MVETKTKPVSSLPVFNCYKNMEFQVFGKEEYDDLRLFCDSFSTSLIQDFIKGLRRLPIEPTEIGFVLRDMEIDGTGVRKPCLECRAGACRQVIQFDPIY